MFNTNFTNWETSPKENTGLSDGNTYTLTDGTNAVATLVGKGCKLNDTKNLPTSTGIEGYNTNKFRFGSDGNYVYITPNKEFNNGGKIRILVSAEKTKTTDILGTVVVGDESLGNLHGWTAKAMCDWQEFEVPETISGIAQIKITRTDNTMFIWGIEVLTNSSAPVTTYTVTYNANDGSGEMAQTTNEIVASTFTAPNGKMFKEWNTAADGTGTSYAAGDEVTDNLNLYAIWKDIQNFDVKFYFGYGENTQIGETQSVILDSKAEKPADPTREGYRFVGWSTDGTEANIKTIEDYAIIEATTFTAIWKQVYTVTFDGSNEVKVDAGTKVASIASPTQPDKVFAGWYNSENKWNFSSNVEGNMSLVSKWTEIDPNHYVYAYNDDFHYDGDVYKAPDGKVDNNDNQSNKAIATPYTLFEGAEGITSVVVTKGIYDSKGNHINAFLKLNTNSESNLVFTIKGGYAATLKMKMGSWNVEDAQPTLTFKDASDNTYNFEGEMSGNASGNNYAELTYNLTAGTYTLTTATKTLYISNIDLTTTALAAYQITYKANGGVGEDVVVPDATLVAECSFTYAGKKFIGWNTAADGTGTSYEVGAVVDATLELYAQWVDVYTVSFDLQGHGAEIAKQDIISGEKATKPADPVVIGWDFGGWFTDEECTAGNEFDFDTPITAATPLYAKWTKFEGCTLLVPATSGPAIAVGDEIAMQTGSSGATMVAISSNSDCTLAYESYGLSFASSGNTSRVKVTLDHELAVGSKITLVLVANGSSGSNRALDLYKNTTKVTSIGWTSSDTYAKYAEGTFTYTVTNEDGLAGMNEFSLYRNNSVFLQKLTVEACGAAITYHNLTSEVNIAGKGTVTLGASSVREGYTTTATYSVSDPLYEFVNWTVSGEGASVENATANPATITVGTEDAVVTLNLRLIPVKFTVEYYNGATLMGSEQVVVNEHPTASEIVTAKRGYVFEGWATSSTATASDVINLNTITSDVATAIPLYAIYTAVPCVSEGTVFSMTVTDPAETQYEENNDFGLEIGATYLGGKAYSGSKSTTKRIGEIDKNGEYSFNKNSDVAVKVALDCALQEGDVIIFTTSTKRELKIKKVVGTDLVTTSSKKYTIPAESPLIGEYDFYLMRDNSESTFKTLKVERPYTILFDMQGHGDAIEAQKLIAGDKVVEPTAPTADGWDFKGWYKESACTNAWDFENDVVAGTMALYAKWDVHVTNDATLKSLKYGETEIALEAGVFEYNIGLPALTASVPTLTAVANSVTVHSLDIADAAEFDVDGKATSTVTVVSEDETVTNVYTVNFTKLPSMPLLDVDNSIVWDFDNAGTQNNAFTDEVLANFPGVTNDATFRAQTLKATGAKIEDGYLQGSPILFHATKDGLLRVEFSNTGSKTRPYRYLVVNGERTAYKSNNTTHVTTAWIEVPAGDVTIEGECVEDANGECTSDNLNFYKIEFLAVGYTRDNLNPTNIATICLPNGGIMTGATLYKMAGKNEYNKLCFVEVQDNIMVAGNPYLFVPENGNTKINVYYTDKSNVAAGSDNGLYGTYVRLSTVDDENSLLWGKYIISNNKYIYVDANNCNLAANRAYIVLNEVQPIQEQNHAPGLRRIVLGTNESQVATGVDQVQGDEVPTKMIINGQLFILRGEKMYDAQGKLVK